MSIHAVRNYQSEVERIIHFGGTSKESTIRNEFQRLLNDYAKGRGLMLIPEVSMRTPKGRIIQPDGTLKDSMQLDWGYWESKDEADDINEEIRKKFAKDYPSDNILFEDSNTAVLFQGGTEIARVSMQDAEALDGAIRAFIEYERPEVKTFRAAIDHFKQDVPKVTAALNTLIDQQEGSRAFVKKRREFLTLAKEAINKDVTEGDVREMMIQHILTADIFNTIFDEPHFHRENNVARELEKVVDTFFTGPLRRATLERIKQYYDVINAQAARIYDHHEKQKFLKVVYETFYKSYNPKAADRLGVVYTPGEIVQFMIKSTDWLLDKHFGKRLEDKGVDILDPATGTGTFICDIIDHIRRDKLAWKYANELHANEVAILPYYISNLNIEFTYKQKMKEYAEFENLCFVDTLDNLGFKFNRQNDLFNPFTEENSKRIMRQNSKKIAVVIGNPPYNANQQNENDNNKNRAYPEVDARIKETFIKQSTAQKTKVYDMYARFYRWAFDRLADNGIVAFVTNRSFIDSRTFDGFRKTVQTEFDHAYIIDTKSDVRANPKISGTGHNVFGIQTGVAVMFLVKKEGKTKAAKRNCEIQYVALDDFWRKEEKLAWFNENRIEGIDFERLRPDKGNNWVNISDENDWDTLIPLCSKDVKSGKSNGAIFKLISNGIVTARDEWSYDFLQKNLADKASFFVKFYHQEQARWNNSAKKIQINDFVKREIKFGSEIEAHLVKGDKITFNEKNIIASQFRPFIKRPFYFDRIYTHRIYQLENIFGLNGSKVNKAIAFLSIASSNPLSCLVVDRIFDAGLLKQGNGLTTSVPLWYYDDKDNRQENITDWALKQFIKKYGKREKAKSTGDKTDNRLEADPEFDQKHLDDNEVQMLHEPSYPYANREITKESIFHYVYGVLHNPAYREKYALNLKRDFPRIPLYDDFWEWSNKGKALMEVHLNYETAEPYPLERVDIGIYPAGPDALAHLQKAKLKADKEAGMIEIDAYTTLRGIPKEAWEYKLGNRSALEWVLDQYKEKKPKDPTIAEKFDTYRFADYKEEVIDLLGRVCGVSVGTGAITQTF